MKRDAAFEDEFRAGLGLEPRSRRATPRPAKPAKPAKPATVAAASSTRDATPEVEALLAKVRPLIAHQAAVAATENHQLLAAAHPGVPTQWPVASRRADSPQVSPLTPPAATPTLFEGGDLPAVTAWGGDPQVLLNVPWQARPAVAEAPTQAAAYVLLERYGGPDGALMAELHAQPGGPLYSVVADYQTKLSVYAAAKADEYYTSGAAARADAAYRDERVAAAAAEDRQRFASRRASGGPWGWIKPPLDR